MSFVSLLLASCTKQTTQEFSTNESETLHLKTGGIVYAIQTCNGPEGQCGAQCAQTEGDDDCCMATECKYEGANFQAALVTNYTPAQIQEMTEKPIRITDPKLVKALKDDGFCIK